MLIICFLLLISYLILPVIFITGWNKVPNFHTEDFLQPDIKISVIIPLHNEEKNVKTLIQQLIKQTHQPFEIILIDDHSTDSTYNKLLELTTGEPVFKVLSSLEKGKKSALKQAVYEATGAFIITTDADVELPSEWIQNFAAFYSETKSDLIIGSVEMKEGTTFFDAMQRIEFVSLVASGAGACGAGMPVLCNGANLGFTKKAWLESQEHLRFDIPSGDDIFLLSSVKKRGGKISFLKSRNALVKTFPATDIRHFIRQRQRWGGKSTAYTDFHLIYTALSILLISITEIYLLICSFFSVHYLIAFLTIFLVKYVFDASLIQTVSHFFEIKKPWIQSFYLSTIYPFYIVIVALKIIIKPGRVKTGW